MDKKLLEEIGKLFRELHKGYPKGRNYHKLVTTAGKPVRLTPESHPCSQVLIKALRANTGYIEVGFDGDNTLIGRGHELENKEWVIVPINDLNKVFIDSTVNGEGVSLMVML